MRFYRKLFTGNSFLALIEHNNIEQYLINIIINNGIWEKLYLFLRLKVHN